MSWRDSDSNFLRVSIAAVLLFFLILAVYFNTFDAVWQFDDKPNILDNNYLHVREFKVRVSGSNLFYESIKSGTIRRKTVSTDIIPDFFN